MKFQYLGSLKSHFGLFGSLALAACSSANPTAPSVGSVDSAYAALVSEIADCAKEVKTCVDAAADDAARDLCREQFTDCRETAGEHTISEIATAVRSCTEAQKACVKDAHGAGAAACQEDLNTCLGAAHPAKEHDDAAHAADGGRKNGDCLQELRACVEADGPAKGCTESVRSCVVDSMPSALEVVPKGKGKKAADADDVADEAADADDAADEADADDAADEADADGDANESAADGDANKGQSGDHGREVGADNANDNAGKPDDAGSKGEAASGAARACVDAFAACVDAGSSARSCVMGLKECHGAGK